MGCGSRWTDSEFYGELVQARRQSAVSSLVSPRSWPVGFKVSSSEEHSATDVSVFTYFTLSCRAPEVAPD